MKAVWVISLTARDGRGGRKEPGEQTDRADGYLSALALDPTAIHPVEVKESVQFSPLSPAPTPPPSPHPPPVRQPAHLPHVFVSGLPSPGNQPISCHLQVTNLPAVCHLQVTKLPAVCHLHVTNLPAVCHLHVTNLLAVCHLHVTSLSAVCHLHVTHLSAVCHLHVTNLSW